MKKAIMVMGVAALLGGCTLPFMQKAATDQAPTAQEQKKAGQPFSGLLKDAVALGVPMKCTYEIEEGKTATGYIKGKMYYGEMEVDGKMSYSLVKDECFWGWTANTKQGMTMCMKDLPSPKPGSTEAPKSIWDNSEVEAAKMNMNCVPAVVDDALFTPPADVTFADAGKMMQGVQEMMQKVDTKKLDELKKMMPNGVPSMALPPEAE